MSEKLWRITLDTNPEDCNLSCIMCEEHSKFSTFKVQLYQTTGIKHRRMPVEWIEPLFAEAQRLGVKEIIPSTMGEPLMYKHINKFFEFAGKYSIKINLTTNGTFPGKSTDEWARLIIPVTSDTKISFNGASKETAESIMLGMDYEKQWQNIETFVAFRNKHFSETGYYSRITLQLTFMRHNMPEISEMIKKAAALGIDRIKGHQLWTHFAETEALSFEQNTESRQAWNRIVEEALKAAENHIKPDGNKILLENFIPFELNTEVNSLIPEHYHCPFLEKELWISATGKISPCCAPDLQRNSLGNFGNYPETKLSEVLQASAYLNLVENYKNFYLCKMCKMRRP